MPDQASTLGVVSVTTEDYLPGTLVTLSSFLTHNPWFNGDLLVIHDQLDSTHRQHLNDRFDRIRFVQVSPDLEARVHDLCVHHPALASRRAQFHALEVFRLSGYDRLLYCDSDLLFRNSVESIFRMDADLLCCGDKPYYLGAGRDRRSFAFGSSTASFGQGLLRETFNSGFMLIGRPLLDAATYARLIDLIHERTWRHIRSDHTDQLIFNLGLTGRQTIVSGTYNYLLGHRKLLHGALGLRLGQAAVLHYNGPAKPWQTDRIVSDVQRDPALIQAFKLWYDAYIASLELGHVKTHLPNALRPTF
jgi:lipopolysaccharide biosynthesis glycosyltransferase